MAGRKSLMHPMVEELRNESSSSSPLRRRSSIAQKASVASLEENDDEAERLVRRLEKNQHAPVGGDKRRSMGLGFVAQMSGPQIAERISQCIKLHAENKINVKNAFSLEMIDFMTYMSKKRDGDMSNLQVASTSLDISTKIYGFRVDGVHTEILKMIGGLDKQEKNDERRDGAVDGESMENEEGGAAEAQKRAKEQRKKKKKRNTFSTIEAIGGKIETINPESLMFNEGDSQTTDLLYQAILPHHANNGFCLNPYNDVIFDTIDSSVELDANTAPIACPKIDDFTNKDICASFANFKFLGWSVDEEIHSSPEKSHSMDDPLQFDLDASLPADDEPNSCGLNYFDIENNDNTENVDRCAAVNHAGPANIIDLRQIVRASRNNKPSEYSYFQDIDIQWAGPSHWKIRHASKNLGGSRLVEGCGQQPIRRKKELILSYNDEMKIMCEPKFDTARSNFVKLQAKTAKNHWSEEKVTLPQDMHYDPLECCKLYTRPKVVIEFPQRDQMEATHVSDDVGDYNYDNEHDTTDFCPNVNCEDGPKSNEDCANNAGDYDDELGAPTQPFTGDNLVEAPKINSKIFIPFSQRAKKIDMRQLKKCIWKMLTSDSIDKENVESTNFTRDENHEKIDGTKKFSDIFKNLPKTLSKVNNEALSVPIAFISLLHIANEKTLEIQSLDNYSDLAVRQG